MTLGEAEAEQADAGPPAPPSTPLPDVAVAGVAVTAHMLASLEQLFAAASKAANVAWVVTPRQAEAIDAHALAESLGRASGLPCEVATDGVRPEAGRIYVAPSDQLMTFADGRLHMRAATEAAGERGTVDSFLVSLAEANGRAAVGVLLAGLGVEGTAGIMALKGGGGLLVCERDERTGIEDLHPLADPSGLADFVLAPQDIPARVGQYIRHLRESPAGQDEQAAEEQIADQIRRIAAVLRKRTGHDFHGYKHGTFLRRIARRMQVNAIDAVEGYIAFLRDDTDEVHHLFQDLLIGVTQFFRDKPEFELLEREVVPRLFADKGAGDRVRVWVLGCSSGEEAYSIAILLREHMATLDTAPEVQIFATDIDGRALSVARAGRYAESIAKDVSPERLLRWFTKEGITYRVNKELREMCIFSQHNVIKDAPFSRIDLCSCRNLLIYLTGSLQDRVLPLFHFALRGQGYLFLGSSENVTRHQRLFSPIDRQRRIFRRVDTGVRVLPEFPLSPARARGTYAPRPVSPSASEVQLGRQAERVVERHAPAYVLVDPRFEVLSFSGRTGRFLEPAAGSANLNVVNLVHRDLRVDLRAALQRASLDKTPVTIDRIALDESPDGERRRVDLIVEPLPGNEPPGYVVLFREAATAAANDDDTWVDAAVLRDEHVQRLEGELRLTRERLQATIEELESTNEELKSSNEEYQSINEELQSANEELETSKEELQSVNEELHTVNGELAQRVNELGRANSDLKNLLESTQIATVFLDNDLRVKGFTPAMADVFHLIETDVGRPLNHIASRIHYPAMQDDVRRVLRTLTIAEREIGAPTDRRYHVRVLPYRSLENYIAGVVITFLDVSEIAQAQTDVRRSEARLRTIADFVPDLLWASTETGAADWCNKRWTDLTGQPANVALGWGWTEVFHPDERAAFREAYAVAARDGAPYQREHRLRVADGAYRWFSVTAQAVEFESEGQRYFGAATEIDAFRRADDRHRLLVAELQHRVKNILAVVRSISARSLETSDTLEEFSAHFAGRLDALARTQGVIARKGEEGVELEDVVRDELAASVTGGDGRVRVAGPPVLLKEKAAEIFALALHELTTNAVKYGALSTPAGKISVEWRLMNTSEGRRLSLEWRESGVPALNSRPSRNGFGRDLIEEGLPYDLGAVTSLDFAPGGVRCTVELPLGDRVIALDAET